MIIGVNKLNIVLKTIEMHIENELFEDYESITFKKLGRDYIDVLLLKTFVFYVKTGTKINPSLDGNIEEFKDDIIFIDDIEAFILLYNLDFGQKNKHEVNWIIVEAPLEIMKTKHLTLLNKLDYWKKLDAPGCVYRLDIPRMESSFNNILFDSDKAYKKNARGSFYQTLLNITTSDNKTNKIPYVKQPKKPIHIKYNKIEIAKEDYKNVYKYSCLICEKEKEVILSQSQRKGKQYQKVNESFISHNKDTDRIEVICSHKGTNFENKKSFSVSIETLDIVEVTSLDKIFLFLFNSFANDNGEILFLNSENDLKPTLVEKFLEKNYESS
ncbi:MAG: hypothetical protein COA44_15815 [Arcobacter sp.]|nr:MAG: hypothetical protein COA44_15815 [Arcobacter sp.]